MTKIIATIGPSSDNVETLKYFKNNKVQIIRQNMSHGTVEWHAKTSQLINSAEIEILLDCPGPKVRLGDIETVVVVEKKQKIILESQKENVFYPYKENDVFVFPSHFPTHKHIKPKHHILVDDGKLEWQVEYVEGDRVFLDVLYGGPVKSRKGMNMPDTYLDIEFLTARDKEFLSQLLIPVKPKYVAVSFVKNVDDLIEFKNYIDSILSAAGEKNYKPQICIKLEMGSAVTDDQLPKLVEIADLIMVARGDLALEIKPTHIGVPFIQAKIKNECVKAGKPFIIATQILDTMMENSVPTRAEVSDIYRATVIDRANFIMCSGETAAGSYPMECVKLMSQMIDEADKYFNKINEKSTIETKSNNVELV